MLQHFITQFLLYYLSSGHLREIKGQMQRNLDNFSFVKKPV